MEEQPICERCKEKGKEPHPCPFKVDIHDDDKTLCTCCDACKHECEMDI